MENKKIRSFSELQNQMIIARDLKYVNKTKFDRIAKQTIIAHKLISRLKKVKNHT